MKKNMPINNLIFIGIGICAFLFKTLYKGPFLDFFLSYWGNFWVSFTVYFIIGISNQYWRQNDFITALCAIVILESFEITDGYWGIFTNVYDPLDLVFNIWGVIVAITMEIVLSVVGTVMQEKVIHSVADKH